MRVAVTFDNLGGVEGPGRDAWMRTLPRLLDALAGRVLRATFFVEGINAERHPETLRRLAAAGHEVALHGWEHEPWAGLGRQEERRLLERGVRALDELGLRPAGFRPPGGGLTASTLDLLRELGLGYCSPAMGAAGAAGGPEAVVLLPFRWTLVDALYYLPAFADARERELGTRAAQPPARLAAAIAGALVGGEPEVVLVLHAFLAAGEERFAVVAGALERVRALVDAGAAVCAPCRELAADPG